MNNLAELLDDANITDHQIKMSLLEVEFEILAKALSGLKTSQQEVFLRNTTYSAKKQLIKLLGSYKLIDKNDVLSAQDSLFEIINRNIISSPNIDMPDINETEPIRVETHNKHEIFACLLDISQKVHKEGIPSLETTMKNINDTYLENFILKKGLEYVLAGRDSKTSKSLLENLKKAMLQNIEEHLDMILTGIEQIQKGHSAKELVKTLKNYL